MTQKEELIWAAESLFNRGVIAGTTGNVSYCENNDLFVSMSGSCLGKLSEESFVKMELNDDSIIQGKPSKEYPLHRALYLNEPIHRHVVIHTHSFYSTLFSCDQNIQNDIPNLFSYTPYLQIMTGGFVSTVPYAPPGSEQLFSTFSKCVNKDTNVYFLENHGVIVTAETVIKCLGLLEEVEASCRQFLWVNETQYRRII